MIIETGEFNRIIGVNDDAEFEAQLLKGFMGKDDLILFPWRSVNLSHPIRERNRNGSNWNDFVLEHTIIKARENPFGWDFEKDENEYDLWYTPNNEEDLKRIIKFEWLCYDCCIIPKHGELKDYKYLLKMYEHDEYNGSGYRSLFIWENEKGSFLRDIVPIIKPILEKYDEDHPYEHNEAYFFGK